MGAGIRVEMRIDGVRECPMARASAASGAACELVARTVPQDGEAAVTEEFIADEPVPEEAAEEVFRYGKRRVYRARRPADVSCPCTVFDRLGYPLVQARVEGERMAVVTHLHSIEDLQEVVSALRESYDRVVVERLVRPGGEGGPGSRVLFDVSRLTERQREVVRRAYDLGYFEYPRGANAGEVAADLGISRSTFVQHLTAAQAKLFGELVDD